MTRVKIAVSLPEEQVAAAKQAVSEGRAPSVSAYVSHALEKYDHREGLRRYLEELDERYGRPAAEDYAWAEEQLAKADDDLRRRDGNGAR